MITNMLDDLLVNVEMARSLNINAIHFKSINDFSSQLDKYIHF